MSSVLNKIVAIDEQEEQESTVSDEYVRVISVLVKPSGGDLLGDKKYIKINNINEVQKFTDTDIENIKILTPPFYLVFDTSLNNEFLKQYSSVSLTVILPNSYNLTDPVFTGIDFSLYEGVIILDIIKFETTFLSELPKNSIRFGFNKNDIYESRKYAEIQEYKDSSINDARVYPVTSANITNFLDVGLFDNLENNGVSFYANLEDNLSGDVILYSWRIGDKGVHQFYIEKQFVFDIQQALFNTLQDTVGLSYSNIEIKSIENVAISIADNYLSKGWILAYEYTPFEVKENMSVAEIHQGLIKNFDLKYEDRYVVRKIKLVVKSTTKI